MTAFDIALKIWPIARLAPLPAEQHELIRKSGEALAEALKELRAEISALKKGNC